VSVALSWAGGSIELLFPIHLYLSISHSYLDDQIYFPFIDFPDCFDISNGSIVSVCRVT
jgi:hypothetical protein